MQLFLPTAGCEPFGGINHNGVGELRHANDQRNVEQRLLLIKREAVIEAAMFVNLRSMIGGGDKK